MKTLGTILAAAGVALLASIGAATAQAPTATGTGSAAQENKPSTAGMSNPGGRPAMTGMRMGKRKMMKRKRMKRRM